MLKEFHPAKHDVLDGVVVLIDPYTVGMSMIALASGIARAPIDEDINPFEADLYINIYQWTLRFLSLIPNWSAGTDGHFCRTLKTWRRRWQYMDSRVPDWMRSITPISKQGWAAEDLERKRFKAYAESAFIKHYRYPSKVFNNFDSFVSAQTSAFKPPSSSLSQP
ncbi:hypothetical protein MSG28_000987 [Choristoneura fumiferana]|uniref:Uncharacterized protein n=2 Tax=Choristoneura fumiferana TaxID=7141 RepID=A0ACC0K3Q6_CHOFU|nr:hypothetical protein MSG28_000987 [Choristoneura fumiferana]